MPKITFPSEWLKANENVKAGDLIKFLDAGAQDKDGQWIFRVAVLRNGVEIHQKKFSLNKKNFNALKSAYGDNSDAWIGREMEVRVIEVENPRSGEIVPAVRLAPPGGSPLEGEEIGGEEDEA